MKFGHFDLENKEYVITRPDTPAPWVNYVGSSGIRSHHIQQCSGLQLCEIGGQRPFDTLPV